VINVEKTISNRILKKSLTLLNNKYKFEIIFYLGDKKMRFTEIKKNIGTITQQLLTKLLREMEKDKLIVREKYNGLPRRVDYSLTNFGKSTKIIVNCISRWEQKNLKTINKVMKKKIVDSIYDYY